MDSLTQRKKHVDPQIQGLLSDIIKVIPNVVQVYLNKGLKKKNTFRYRWNIIIDASKNDINNKFLPIVQGLFFDHQDYFHNIFSRDYAKTELANGTLVEIPLSNAKVSVAKALNGGIYLLYLRPRYRISKIKAAVDFLVSELTQP